MAFSLGIHDTVLEVHNVVKWKAWYLDDGLLVARVEELGKALTIQRCSHPRAVRTLRRVFPRCLWSKTSTQGCGRELADYSLPD